MSRKNYVHTMDAFIHGYSNLIATPSMATPPVAYDEEHIRPATNFAPSTPTFTASTPMFKTTYDEDVRPTRGVAPSPVYVKPDSTPIFSPSDEDIRPTRDITPLPVYVKPDSTPIINIISPSPYVAPTLTTGGATSGGATSGGATSVGRVTGGGGGGGSTLAQPRKPLSGSAVVAKPSFLKKNFIPLLLVATAIFVFIKKPIK